ncbi:MAG: hypothetical protein ACLGHX_14485 [Acidimicrobiia bacterium]
MRDTDANGLERGTTALLVASALLLLFGAAAVAIDIGAGFNERRQNQTVADVAVMAAAVEYARAAEVSGISLVDLTEQALEYAEANLTTSYDPIAWEAMWSGCSDPNKNDGGFNFQPLPAPTTWTASTLDCVSIDATGFLRVRVPDQLLDTTFARVIGFTELTTNAWAIAEIQPSVPGGILPFAILGGGGAGHYCLRSGTGGGGGGGGGNSGVPDPCTGPNTGNFGTIDSPLFGNPALETTQVCSQTANARVLATNIALGFDHPVFKNFGYPSAGARKTDVCFEEFPNALATDQGMGQGTEAGLINGTAGNFHSPKAAPRLQSSNDTTLVVGVELDDQPLWEFLLPDETVLAVDSGGNPTLILDYGPDDEPTSPGTNAPAECDPATFDNGSFDWDGDGTDDPNRSYKHMQACIVAYIDGGYSVQMFSDAIGGTESNPVPRFAYVPQFHQTTFPSGGSDWRDIKRFRAVYLQGLWFGTGNNETAWHPREGSAPASGNLRQVSAFILPDEALPADLRSDPPPNTRTFYQPFLYR